MSARHCMLAVALLTLVGSARAQEFWRSSSEGLERGNASRIVVGADGAVLTASYAGIWSTRDRGASWQRIVLPDRISPNSLYSTSRGNLIATVHDSSIVSTDGGRTWARSLGANVHHEIVEDGVHLYSITYGALLRSSDDGLSWTTLPRFSDSRQRSLANVVALAPGNLLAVISDSAIVQSRDAGVTWHVLAPLEGVIAGGAGLVRTHAGALLLNTADGMMRSSDLGRTWTRCSEFALLVHAAEADALFGSTTDKRAQGLYRSVDDGRRWERVSDARFEHPIVESDGELYTWLRDRGLVRSRTGSEWISIDADRHEFTVQVFFSSHNGDVIAGVTRGRHQLVRSLDDGRTWSVINDSLPERPTAVHVDRAGRIFVCTSDWSWDNTSTLSASSDDGTSWHVLTTDIPGTITTFIETSDGTLFAGSRRDGGFGSFGGTLYRSLDNGMSWDAVIRDAPIEDIVEAADGSLVASSCETSDAAPPRGRGWRSTDRGETWSDVLGVRTLPEFSGLDLVIAPDGKLYTGDYGDVLRSDDNGATWSRFTALPRFDEWYGPFVENIVADGRGNVYVSSRRSGISRSDDNGATWSAWNSGNPTMWINALHRTAQGTVLVGTRYNGILRAQTPAREGEPPAPARTELALEDPTPNPAVNGAMVAFTTSVDAQIDLTLTNTLGQRVSSLLSAPRRAGRYSVRIDTRYMADGVYYVVLVANGTRIVRPLVVTKRR